ncbi:MAG: histidine kinase [Bacteroidota bacterium]
MKIKCFLLLFLIGTCYISRPAIAQSKTRFGNKFNFEMQPSIYEKHVIHVEDTAVYKAIEGYKNRLKEWTPKSPIMLGVKLNPESESVMPKSVRSGSKTYSSYFIGDGAEVIIIALGINSANVDEYLYRVVENDSLEITPWSKIPLLEQKYGAKQPYGFIGRFKSPGKQLIVEVKNIKDYSIRDGIMFDWRTKLKPVLNDIAVFARANARMQFFSLKNDEFNLRFANKFDSVSKIPLDFKFKKNAVEDIQLYFNDHFGMPYTISIRSDLDGASGPFVNEIKRDLEESTYQIARTHFYYPGKYEIIVNRSADFGALPDGEALHIYFEVTPGPLLPEKIRIEQVILICLILLFVSGMIFIIYNNRSKAKLQLAAQQKQQAGLKLKSIRSQLNPHFMFNALSSIQNLINKNDVVAANHYLSVFSGLTRRVLDTSNEEFISLDEEIVILDDYIKMEQLRFGFNYEIMSDQDLDLPNTEVPAMLFQPFVENAIKHGISGQDEKGRLAINISKEAKNLIFIISDNGKGFNKEKEITGYGLKLSDERVELLNQLYKDQPISLSIATGDMGTTVTVKLENWLA